MKLHRLVPALLASTVGFILLGAAIAAGPSSAASSAPSIVFDDSAQQAELVIPTPACPSSQPTCEWKFVLQIPKGDITVGVLYGTSGTLVIPYPANFCGVIQADAYVGPPYVPKRGFQHTIEDCTQPTATTDAPTTPTDTAPVPPVVGSGSGQPPTAPAPTEPTTSPASGATGSSDTSGELPFTASPSATSAASDATAAPTQLPFTGVDTRPLWLIGFVLIALGLALVRPASAWRRTLRLMLAATPMRTTVPKHRIGTHGPRRS